MKHQLVSLSPTAPPGFEHRSPSKLDLLDGHVVIYSETPAPALTLVDGLRDRIFGVVITVASSCTTTPIGRCLWHMTITHDQLPHLQHTAVAMLTVMAPGTEALDQNQSLRTQIARSRSEQKLIRLGHSRSAERLRQRIEELRLEVVRRTAAEEQLRLKDFIIRSATSVISTSTLDGTITYVNPAFLKAWRCDSEDQVIGRSFTEFWQVEHLQDEIMTALTSSTGIWSGEIQARRLDGTLFDVHVSATSVQDDKGKPVALMATSIDISERKRAHAAQRALEMQVQQAQKVESLGLLAGGVAHDFNNLLVAILGNAELALDVVREPRAHQYIDDIVIAGRRAAKLANQMLAYSGKGQFAIQSIQLGELIDEMAQLIDVSLAKGATLTRRHQQGLAPFRGDVTQIRQVVMNLITNASEALGETPGAIELSTGTITGAAAELYACQVVHRPTEEPLPSGTYVYLQVRDTGCGMTADTLTRVFDPFFSTKFFGRGLGMSAVLGIVRGHGGAIQITSELGKGTTFRVLFPASAVGAPAQTAPPKRPSKWMGTGTILLVDDERSVRQVGRRMLEAVGFDVLVASDGAEAVDVYRERWRDIVCVMLDLTMPNMDGDEAYRQLRAIHPGLCGIMCSGYSQQEVSSRFTGDGPSAFLRKPYRLRELRSVLRSLLSVTPAHGA